MASPLVWLGRFAFFVLMILQYVSFASYPATYENQNGWYGLLFLYLPALILWFYILYDEGKLRWIFFVWGLYVWLALVPTVGIMFGIVEDKLEKGVFFGPNVLKMTFCLTPLLLLLLLNTGADSHEYRELVSKLSFQITLDLFDGVEMLEVVLEENELMHGLPKGFENAIIAIVCISFLLSPGQLMENKLQENRQWKIRRCSSALRITIQVLCVNTAFLGLRLVLFFKFGKDASIFIAKNGIIIILGFLELCSIFSCCGCEQDQEQNLIII